ncbi:MAG: sodium:solute symporter family protein [candidate division KSB1 bacterium]|nr:sodium:solute symporter family protein [candidate division KSB1 bacterium]MDZ7301106.1 sodium:solute symporter family protein [candidate division KSB1 bacterium]MDZ7312009.1 sodium:solute symporter family protein [candidate division KSB1 bacterium]
MATFAYWLGFVAYSVVVIGMGFYIYRRDLGKGRQIEANEFWDAKKNLSASSVGLSISASMMSISWSCVYGVQLFYWYGLGAAWLLAIPWLMAMVGFYLLTPRFRQLTAFSQPEMLGRRFGTRARQLLALPLAFVFLIWCGAEIYASAIILAPLLQTSKHVMLLLMALVVAAYSSLGGFEADVVTDKVQYLLVAFFIATMAYLGLHAILQHESAATFLAKVPTPPKTGVSARSLFAAGPALIILTLVSYLPGWLVETDVWIRLQAARSATKARQAVVIAATNSLIFVGLLPMMIGLSALYLYPPVDGVIPPALKDGATIFAVLMQDYSPVWLNVLLVVGLAAASMSTIDTCGNVAALSVCYDIIVPSLRNYSKKAQLILARVISVLAIVAAYIYSLFTESLWDIFYLSSGILTTTIFLPMIAIFLPNTRPRQVHAAIVAGFVGTLLFYFLESRGHLTAFEPQWLATTGLGYILWGFAASLLAFIIVGRFGFSFASKPELPVEI